METKTPENKLKYNRNYYHKNKERIRQQKKNRYQSDADYRNKMNLQRRIARAKKALGNDYASLKINEPPEEVEVKEVKYDCMMKVLSPDQTKSCVCKMYTMSGTAMKLKVDKTKLVHWIYLEYLPNARYRNSQNWRLFTEFEVEVLVKAFNLYRKKATLSNYKFKMTKDLTKHVNNKFDELIGGIPSDQFTEES